MGGEENGSLRIKEKALSGHEGHVRPSTSATTDCYYLITELNVCQLFSIFFLIFPNVRKTRIEPPPREDLKKKLHSAIQLARSRAGKRVEIEKGRWFRKKSPNRHAGLDPASRTY
jgi:hypothetical protein